MRIKSTQFLMGSCLLLIIIGNMLTLTSCTKEKDEPKEKVIASPMPEIPTEDQLDVKSAVVTYVALGNYQGVGQALINRMTSKAANLDSSVQAIVVNDSSIESMSEQDHTQLINMMTSGGSLVYFKPTKTKFQATILTLGLIVQSMYENGEFEGAYNDNVDQLLRTLGALVEGGDGQIPPFFEDDNDSNAILCEAICINNRNFYILKDLGDLVDAKAAITTVDAEGNKTEKEVEHWVSDAAMTPYQLGAYADLLARWLNDQSDSKAKQKALNEEKKQLLTQLQASNTNNDLVSFLDDAAKCQEVKYTYYAEMPAPIWRKVPVTATYKIWAVYSPTDMSDYYLIRQETRAENSWTNCGPTSANLWYTRPEHEAKYGFSGGHTYGSYMSKLHIENHFVEEGAQVVQVSPNNDLAGSTSYSEGFNWSLNLGIYASASPSISAGGSVGFSKSWTTNIPDLDMTFKYNNNSPTWTYSGVSPESSFSLTYINHDLAKKILISDCTVGQCWIWKCRVLSPEKVFSFKSTVNYSSQMLGFKRGFFKTYPQYYTVTSDHTYTTKLLPPPRAIQKWQMDCKPYSTKMQNFLATNYGNYWRPYLALNTSEASDRTVIDASVDAFIKCLENSRNKWMNAGYAGQTIVFSWKLEDEAVPYREFKFTIPQ